MKTISKVALAIVRRVFCTRAILRATHQFLPYVGYGLYVAAKP